MGLFCYWLLRGLLCTLPLASLLGLSQTASAQRAKPAFQGAVTGNRGEAVAGAPVVGREGHSGGATGNQDVFQVYASN